MCPFPSLVRLLPLQVDDNSTNNNNNNNNNNTNTNNNKDNSTNNKIMMKGLVRLPPLQVDDLLVVGEADELLRHTLCMLIT